MREIKFRTWYGGKFHFWGFYEGAKNVSSFIPPIDLLAPQMQYTGLKDKNGKEIYEGDIIYFPRYIGEEEIEPMFLEVSFEDSGFYPFIGADPMDAGLGKIIGNIYENLTQEII